MWVCRPTFVRMLARPLTCAALCVHVKTHAHRCCVLFLTSIRWIISHVCVSHKGWCHRLSVTCHWYPWAWNVCVTVCIFFACLCESECVHVCLPCYRCLCSLMGDRNKNKSISLLNHTLSSTTWQLTTAASVSARVRERVRGYTCVCV